MWLLCEIPICFCKKLSISSVIKNKILKGLQYVVDQFLTDLYKYLRYICNRWRMSFSNSPICKIWSSPHNELFSKLLNICQISLSFFLTFILSSSCQGTVSFHIIISELTMARNNEVFLAYYIFRHVSDSINRHLKWARE